MADQGTQSQQSKKLAVGGVAPGGDAVSGGLGGASPAASAAINRQDLIKGYANMVARCWVDDSYRQLVLTNTAQTLADAGMPTVDGAIIRVIQHVITGSGKIEDQVDAWLQGHETGLYDLFLPMKPDDFNVAPGGGGDACAGGDSCCCCPCCCCT
jgi:hypothetical protein